MWGRREGKKGLIMSNIYITYMWGQREGKQNYRSLLQNISSFIGLFCKRDLQFLAGALARGARSSQCSTSQWSTCSSTSQTTELMYIESLYKLPEH